MFECLRAKLRICLDSRILNCGTKTSHIGPLLHITPFGLHFCLSWISFDNFDQISLSVRGLFKFVVMLLGYTELFLSHELSAKNSIFLAHHYPQYLKSHTKDQLSNASSRSNSSFKSVEHQVFIHYCCS